MATPRYTEHHGHPGVWQLEAHCGDCGAVDRVGKPRLATAPIESIKGRVRTVCNGYYGGRPDNRCGFALSYVWIFYPPGRV